MKIASLTCIGQLAGRAPGQRATGAARPGVGVDRAASERQRERRGLAGAGRGLAEQVVAGEQQRDRLALDRRRLLVAEVVERLEQLGSQAEVAERHSGFFGLRRGVVDFVDTSAVSR